MPEVRRKKSVTVRLSSEAQRLLEALAKDIGVNKTSVLEILIREGAKARGVE